MECCGTNGPTDWELVTHNETLPDACCGAKPVGQVHCDLSHAYKAGCLPKLQHLFESKSMLLASVGVGIALIQVSHSSCYKELINVDFEFKNTLVFKRY